MEKKVHSCGPFGGTETLCGYRLQMRVGSGRVSAVSKRKLLYGKYSTIEISSNRSQVTCNNCLRAAE